MDSMESALLKAGFNKKCKDIISKLNKEDYSIFNQMHQDPKKRKFLLHLIHAFLPNDIDNDLNFIWSWSNIKGKRKCVICEQNIISLIDAYIRVNDNIDENFKVANMFINSSNINVFSEINKKVDNVLSYLFLNKYIEAFRFKVPGLNSKKSKVFMCSCCYKLFNDWAANMLLRKHKDFKYIIGNKIDIL
jgi:hypothetical protein